MLARVASLLLSHSFLLPIQDLSVVAAGAESTIINAPVVLSSNVLGRPYIVDINSGVKVGLNAFTIKGPDGTCPRLVGASVLQDSTLNLNSAIIK